MRILKLTGRINSACEVRDAINSHLTYLTIYTKVSVFAHRLWIRNWCGYQNENKSGVLGPLS